MRLGLLLLLLLCKSVVSETIPTLHGQTFADAQVNLPADLHGKAGILVIGFSKKSSVQTKQWNDALLADYGNDSHVAYYQCAVLADIPGFIRGTVVKGIRGPMAANDRAHFIPILQDSSKWKVATRFTAADDAYVLVVDTAGQIEWRTHGAETPDGFRGVKDALAGLQKSRN